MANLQEKVPGEFSDDERWYRFFTKKSLMTLCGCIAFAFILSRLFSLVNMMALGLIIGVAIGGAVFASTVVKWPEEDPVHGSGNTLAFKAYKYLSVKRNGRIFVRGYRPEGSRDGNT